MLYLSCFKIMGRDDPAKRGVERPYTRATSKVTPAVPVVSVSPSAEVWEEPWGIRRTSDAPLGELSELLQLISGKKKNR